MARWKNVAIIGVGLIGGSIGLDLRQRGLANEVIGIGRSQKSLRAAKKVGAITRGTTGLARGVAEAEIVVACTPVGLIVQHLEEAAAACPSQCLLTDAGSTKRHIVDELDRRLPRSARFIGSHPLAGSEKAGPQHALLDLFQQRAVVITPTRRTAQADVAEAREFWESLGAGVVQMLPEAHDRALAATSHLPHLIASALAASVPSKFWHLSGGGLRDTTRIAASDAELWRQIFLDNREALLGALDKFDTSLAGLRTALEQGDVTRLIRLLEKGKRQRAHIEDGQEKK